MTGALAGRVAVVTGASRGIGKGVALALAEQGATVYVTGRTVTPGSHPLPGTIGETAAACDRRGGRGVPVRVDHGRDEQVAALFERVGREQGRLDILVNNAFALPEDLTEAQPFWEKPLADREMVDVGVRSSFAAARHAAALMVPRKSGLIVAISGYTGVTYTYGVVFGVAKSATDRMARDMAIELKPHGVASVSLWQGLTFTERAERNLARIPRACRTRPPPGRGRLLPRVPRPRHRRPGPRPGRHGPHRRHVHHRRTGPGLRHHRHRRHGDPVAARHPRRADLVTGPVAIPVRFVTSAYCESLRAGGRTTSTDHGGCSSSVSVRGTVSGVPGVTCCPGVPHRPGSRGPAPADVPSSLPCPALCSIEPVTGGRREHPCDTTGHRNH